MVFSDPVFLYFFLPICLLAFWLGAWRVRNAYICVIGSVFYMWGAQAFILLLLATITLNHAAALRLARWRADGSTEALRRSAWLTRGVITFDLAALGLWKYGGFAVKQVDKVFSVLGIDARPALHLTLPIAISFYTFQCISYVVDVRRGTAQPAPRFVDFAAYILLFPHLIAGPIVRYAHIEADLLRPPRRRLDDFAMGAPRFFWGLAKKVMVADTVAAIADRGFALSNHDVTSSVAWLCVFAYAVQIYFDFSGYSDMAIGLARMFGFHFPENFDRPYSAHSVTDFWRRWHMSLSTWFRDYVYIPLGGNRRGRVRTYVNLSIVFLLTGFWHGANWTFVAWGAFHGGCLVVERATRTGTTEAGRWAVPRRALTFVLVCIGWALFRAVDLHQAATFIRAMVIPHGSMVPTSVREVLTRQRVFYLAVGGAVVLLPRRLRVGLTLSDDDPGRRREVLRMAVLLTAAPVACMYALSSTFSPFLYFKF